MIALLSASRFLAWPRSRVDTCPLRILFTRKMLDAHRSAICIPELVSNESALEIAGRMGDRPIHEGLGEGRRDADLSGG